MSALRDMIRLFSRSALLLAPYALIFLLSVLLMYKSSEIFGVEKALQAQKQNVKSLYSPAFSYPVKYFKNKRCQQEKPEILVLGSSRVMQFRSEFFREPNRVYNTGGIVNRIRFLRLALKEWKHKPKMILLGIDFWWFNKAYDDMKHRQFDDDLHQSTSNRAVILGSWQVMLKDLIVGKARWQTIWKGNGVPSYGLLALMRREGFRLDGTYQYGSFDDQKSPIECFHDDLGNFKRREDRLSIFDSINRKALFELDSFLLECRQQNIHVVSFLTPNSNIINDSIQRHSDDYRALPMLRDSLLSHFRLGQIPYQDFMNLSALQENDWDMIDGMHGGEKVYGNILIRLCRHDSLLSQEVDTSFVAGRIKASNKRITVFPNY